MRNARACAVSDPTIRAILSQLRGRRYRFSPGLSYVVGRDTPGLYALWVGCCCLYVGMSKQIGQRLHQHLVHQHNDNLEKYLRAYWKDVEATIARVPNPSAPYLRALEQESILALRPRANKAIPKAG